MKLTLDTSGIQSVLGNLGDGLFQVRRETGLKIVNAIMEESSDLCPVDTGTLKSSQYVIDLGDRIEFGYGGPNDKVREKTFVDRASGEVIIECEYVSDYAATVHEDLLVEHKVGQAKFLEIPINNNANRAKWAIAEDFSNLMQNVGIKWGGRGKKKGRGMMSWKH